MSIELIAVEDCWVNAFPENRDKNFNKRGLGMGRWSALNRSFLKFSLEGLDIDPETIRSAALRLYGRAIVPPCIVEAHYTATGWSETTVTWNNQPPPTIYHSPSHPEGISLMGSTTDIPTVEGWYSLPLDVEFIQHRWGRKLSMILKGYERAEDSYCYASDREAKAGAETIIRVEPAFLDLPSLVIGVVAALPAVFTAGVVVAQEFKKAKII